MQMDKQKLGDIATVEISGVDKKTKDGEQEIRLCNFVDVYYNWAITTAQHDGFMFATARPNEISKFQLKKGQVALTKDSETRDDIGVPTYIADDFDDVILGYHCALITPNKDILDGRYLNALLHTDYAKKYFACNASGSGQRYALSVEALNSFPVPMIPLRNQERIGEIFSALDKKIELNRRINQNLEAMAKQFYDYWFVQFDFPNEEGKPYKSSGGKMVWNEKLKRNIPVGWHCGNLFEIAVFTNGLACQKFRPKDDEESLPVIKIREMHDGISDDTEEVTSNIPESVKVYNGDVLFSWSASLEVMLWAYGLGGLNQHIFKVTSANDFPKSFYYFQLLDYIDVFKKVAEARKTTMGHITQDHLQQSTIAIPDNKDIAVRFEELISPIFEQVVKLHEEISYLIKQRDELLPLLMNGQVSVNSDLSLG
ncbi:restriction endonuclease subunit S [Bacteroides ovatus]|jgi:restriction endonuclease S subunit|nr:restriction endonuclease subunit S [Bacteroides ovatus]KAA4717354.1 restriction endonuclease subunit S [Bacteroides ovatus]